MIREHFATGQSAPTIEQVTKQFDLQILVQPQLSSHQGEVQGEMYWDKDPSIIDKVAKDAHSRWGFTRWWPRCLAHLPPMPSKSLCPIMVYLPQWGRDRYDYAMPDDYSDKQDAYANKALRKVDILRKMLGVEPASIKGLAPLDRTYAYKTMGNPEPGEELVE